MENFFNPGIVDQARTGVFGTMFRGDIPTPMVAAKDVGARAAELLTQEPFRLPSVREILGARDRVSNLGAAKRLRVQGQNKNQGEDLCNS